MELSGLMGEPCSKVILGGLSPQPVYSLCRIIPIDIMAFFLTLVSCN